MKVLTTLVLTAAVAMSGSTMAAGYLKIGDIKGESTDREAATSTDLKADQPVEPAGLLLPAVQSAREAARKNTPRAEAQPEKRSKGKVEASWKVEEGSK